MEKNEVIEKVFRENSGRIIYAIRSTGCPEQDIEDVLHQTMVQALVKFDQLENKNYATAWCVKIAINIALRKKANEKRIKIVDFTSEEEVAEMNACTDFEISDEDINIAEIRMDLKKILDRLNPDFKMPLLMKVVFGFSYIEIAEALGIKEGTVKSRINRAKKMLADMITKGKSKNCNDSNEPDKLGDEKYDE